MVRPSRSLQSKSNHRDTEAQRVRGGTPNGRLSSLCFLCASVSLCFHVLTVAVTAVQ